jgi:hypothetical protein
MKPLLLLLVLLLGVGVYMLLVKEDPNAKSGPAQPVTQGVPIWEQPIPDGTELVDKKDVRLNVRAERRDANNKNLLDFHITEEHGYMVDGARVEFWYRFKDEDTDEWIEDSNRISHFIRDRLPFNDTLVTSTVLRPIEFRDLGADLATTTTENWGVRIIDFSRAMRKKP